MAFAAAALPFLSTALPILGTAASVAAPVIGGMFQAQVANNNSQVEEQNAQYARESGQEQAATASLKGAASGAAVKAGFAANGVDVNSGSAVDVQAGERAANQVDAETILSNANLQAYGYTVQSENDKTQATQDLVGGFLKGAGSLVGSASSLPFRWSSSSADTGTTGEFSGFGSST